jgi:hypothetical protein
MSLSSVIVKNGFSDLKEKLRFELTIHGHEIIVGAIMTAISIGIVVAITGNLNEAVARRGRT